MDSIIQCMDSIIACMDSIIKKEAFAVGSALDDER